MYSYNRKQKGMFALMWLAVWTSDCHSYILVNNQQLKILKKKKTEKVGDIYTGNNIDKVTKNLESV